MLSIIYCISWSPSGRFPLAKRTHECMKMRNKLQEILNDRLNLVLDFHSIIYINRIEENAHKQVVLNSLSALNRCHRNGKFYNILFPFYAQTFMIGKQESNLHINPFRTVC